MIELFILYVFLEWNFVKNSPMQKQLDIHVEQYTSECFWALKYFNVHNFYHFSSIIFRDRSK